MGLRLGLGGAEAGQEGDAEGFHRRDAGDYYGDVGFDDGPYGGVDEVPCRKKEREGVG